MATPTSGNDTLTGTSGNDTIDGLAGNDYISGGAGDDSLIGGLGNDTMLGGIGNDIYVVNVTTDVITENANEGIDTVQSAITFSLAAIANVENLTLTGTAAINATGNALDNVLTGNSANNTLTAGAGNDTLIGLGGNDTMVGGTGNDTYVVDVTTDVITEALNEGTDTVQSAITFSLAAVNNVENLTLTGAAAVNATGNTLNNVLTGNSAANTLTGGAGNDTMIGGAGDDIYVVDVATDVITENANEGTDTIQSAITFSMAAIANVENLTLTGTAAVNATGNSLANVLTGNTAANTLTGGAGDDTLIGGAGNDTMVGGTGNDTYIIDVATDVITEAANEGTDTVQSAITYSVAAVANVENVTLTGTAAVNATGNTLNNVLTGNSAANTLTGGAGDDTLIGLAGNDTMVGGTGNDTYVIDVATDVITEAANEGTDTVQSAITYSISSLANLENVTLTGAAAVNATGNAANNVLTGNSANNTLTGAAGNDTLDGQGGNDTMVGGIGNDTYVVDVSTDVVTEAANEGTDTIQTALTYSLASLANVENLTLTGTTNINGTGNTLGNFLTGNSGANVLDGSLGDDTMYGANGDDTYIVDSVNDVVYEFSSNTGDDKIKSSVDWTLDDFTNGGVEDLELTGTANVNATGNALNNFLTGNSGANVLDGSLGGDTMYGANGDDTYIVDSVDDVVYEFSSNTGADRIESSVSWTLDDFTNGGVESLELTGTANIDGTGNALDNFLTGNSGANILDGNLGNDTMYGGDGDDTYIVDSVDDVVYEFSSNTGDDKIKSSVDWTLDDFTNGGVEDLELTGTANVNATGNALNNFLTGNSGANVLDGSLGDDTMYGANGDDTYIVDSVDDVVYEFSSNTGADRIESSVSWTLDDFTNGGVESLELTGTANIDGTGNALDNFLTGNSGANVLDGSLGGDTMYGANGDDTYIVDSVDDVVYEFSSNTGADRIESSVSWTLDDFTNGGVESLELTGTANIDGTGSALNNFLTGNSGANILDGGLGNDTMYGGDGDDVLLGGLGNDHLEGDTMNDQLFGEDDDDTLIGGVGDDNLFGGTGNDSLQGDDGADILMGDDGADTLFGGAGDDQLKGGAGNDLLQGGTGNDLYFAYGSFGTDRIIDNDSTAGNVDELHFVSATHNNLWLTKVGDDLTIAVVGSGDNVTVQGWFAGSANQVERIFDDTTGYVLNASSVTNLVNAMAQFAPQDLGSPSAPSQLVAAYNTAWVLA